MGQASFRAASQASSGHLPISFLTRRETHPSGMASGFHPQARPLHPRVQPGPRGHVAGSWTRAPCGQADEAAPFGFCLRCLTALPFPSPPLLKPGTHRAPAASGTDGLGQPGLRVRTGASQPSPAWNPENLPLSGPVLMGKMLLGPESRWWGLAIDAAAVHPPHSWVGDPLVLLRSQSSPAHRGRICIQLISKPFERTSAGPKPSAGCPWCVSSNSSFQAH